MQQEIKKEIWVRVGMTIKVDPAKVNDSGHILDAVQNGLINGETYKPDEMFEDDGFGELSWMLKDTQLNKVVATTVPSAKKILYTVVIFQVFGGVEEVYTFYDKSLADGFVLNWCNGGNTQEESLEFASAEEGLEWFKNNQEKVDFTIHLIETPIEFTRDDFMAFYRSDTFHESISVDDAREVFSGVLHGSSDLTKAMLTVMASGYEVDVLDLYSIEELLSAIRRRAKEEGVERMDESKVVLATVRDSFDDDDSPVLDIECRFDDGQKFAAVQVDADFPELAMAIARFLSGNQKVKKEQSMENKLLQLSQEQRQFILELAQEMRTQDTRCTAQPYGLIVTEEKIEVRGRDHGSLCGVHWEDETYFDYERFKESVKESYEDSDENPEWVKFVDKFSRFNDLESEVGSDSESLSFFWYEKTQVPTLSNSNFFLTEKGYEEYVKSNRHNLCKPQSYGIHLKRNSEMARLIDLIFELADQLKK